MAFFKNIFGIRQAMNLLASEINDTNKILLSIAKSLHVQATIQSEAAKKGSEMMEEARESRSQVETLLEKFGPQLFVMLDKQLQRAKDNGTGQLVVEPTAKIQP